MNLTATERDLIRHNRSRHLYKAGYDGLGDWWTAYLPLWNKVQAERATAGHLRYPNPPIPIPPKKKRIGELMLRHFSDPNYDQLPVGEQDGRWTNICALEEILSLLESPGFDALPQKEQTAAPFGRWAEFKYSQR